MIIRGPRPASNFTILDRRIAEDPALSWGARGLLVYLLGKPDHWQVSPAALVNETRDSGAPLGLDGVRALLRQLTGAGYVVRTQARDATGTLGTVTYVVHEVPQRDQPYAVKPERDQPCTAKPRQVSTEVKKERTDPKEKRAANAFEGISLNRMTGSATRA